MAPNPQARLNQLLQQADHPPLDEPTSQRFAAYFALLQKWNAKTNLTAIRDEEGILSRHFLESILCAAAIPAGIETLLDFGSGAGFPGIPIALVRPAIQVTLAESQNKKAAFLREAVRTLNLNTGVYSARAEELPTQFDCVTLRAVDNMSAAVPAAIALLKPEGYLAILTTQEDAPQLQSLAQNYRTHNHEFTSSFSWQHHPLPQTTNRILLTGNHSKLPFNS